MKVLVWNAPWAVQGDVLFFQNCFLKHLLLQANLLANQHADVDLVVNDYICSDKVKIDDKINVINIPAEDIFELTKGVSTPLLNLYKEKDGEFSKRVLAYLAPKLAIKYDAILLWENPVPFLEELFPESLIVHQMPGAFSRAPFPSTVTFDVEGLYKDGALHKCSQEIITSAQNNFDLVDEFSTRIKDIYQKLPYLLEKELNQYKFEKLALLPLQVSNHYAFQADTPYATQMDYLLDVLNTTPSDVGLITTQYVSPKISDTALNPETNEVLRRNWKNLIYSGEFDKIPNISQHLLPQAHKVITCSSSVGIQAMLWTKELEVYGDTFLSNYSDKKLLQSNINIELARKNLVGFILGRQQVLATKVVHDGAFLVKLLDALIEQKKANNSHLEKFVDYTDIERTYNDDLIDSINFSRVAKTLRASSPMLDAEIVTVEKFERSIRNNNIESISFDVFDTLIARPVEVPSDVYQFLELEALKLSEGSVEDFARVRLTAEVETRNSSSEGEITLDQIYENIKLHYQTSSDLIEKIKNREIEMEINLVERRELGYRLWMIAKISRKPITIISDMYLPVDVVAQMLEKTGYTGFEKLYVSSEYGARKKEGQLFDIVIEDQKIEPSSHLHIGDNKTADVDMAQQRGMFAFRIPRAIDRMRSNPNYTKIFNPRSGVGEKSRSVIAGLIAHRFFDLPSGSLEQETLFMGSSHRLGYAALGPLLSAYILWLTRRAKQDGVTRLYFLSREGWILKEVYDALNKNNPTATPSAYLYCSRRAARVAAIKNISGITAVASQPYDAGVKLGRLLNQRFGLEISNDIETIINNSQFKSADTVLDSDSKSRVAFSQLCVELSNEILIQAAIERKSYLRYLEEAGLTNEANPAVVDIGWKANMQGSLGSLIKRPLKGYYYATLQGVERWEMRGHAVNGFAGESLTLGHDSSIINNRHLCEFLTCKADGSLINFSLSKNDVLAPRLRHDEGQSARNLLIQEIHRGAIEFSTDLVNRFGPLIENLVIDPHLAERIFKHFMDDPKVSDAKLLSGQFFEDAFGGVDRKYVIANDKRDTSVWKKGAQVLHAITPQIAQTETPKIVTKTPPQTRKEDILAQAKTKQPQIGEMRKNRVSGVLGFFILPIERLIIRSTVVKKKFDKYKTDRNSFFQDSKDKLAVRWYSFTNPETD